MMKDLLMIFVKHRLIMSQIDFNFFHRNCIETGFIFRRANYFFHGTA